MFAFLRVANADQNMFFPNLGALLEESGLWSLRSFGGLSRFRGLGRLAPLSDAPRLHCLFFYSFCAIRIGGKIDLEY